MGISSVELIPNVQSGGSLIIFQLFRCRHLALNRMFPTLEAGMGVVSLGGLCMLPICPYGSRNLYAHCIVHTPPDMFICPPTSVFPHTLLYICMFSYTICSPYVKGT